MYNTCMKIFEKLDIANSYIGFNIFAICGWLYLPILIDYLRNYDFGGYMIFTGLFLLILWLITTIAFIIFLIEALKTKHLTNNFCLKNKLFKAFKYIGLIITIAFYLIILIV